MSSFPLVVRINMVFSAVRAARAVESCACILLLLLSPASALATNWQAEQLSSIRSGATTPSTSNWSPLRYILFTETSKQASKRTSSMQVFVPQYWNKLHKTLKSPKFFSPNTKARSCKLTNNIYPFFFFLLQLHVYLPQYWNKFHKTQNPKINTKEKKSCKQKQQHQFIYKSKF